VELMEKTMPKINVYLPDDLAEAVKDTGVPVSAICQRALEQAVRRVTAIREIVTGAPNPAGPADPPVVNFTRRVMTMFRFAQASAQAAGLTATGTEHLLAALAADEDSLAIRVLGALEITPRQIRSQLASRAGADGEPPAPPSAEAVASAEPVFGAHAAVAMQLAVTESSGLGNNYIGSEHLLLGLIAEPDGTAGSVLRSLGADLRVTRRTVAAALAGWGAARAAVSSQSAGPGPDQRAELAAAVRSELAPVLARIEHLEQQAAG